MLYLSTSRFWWNVNSGHQRKPARLFALRTPRFARVRYADSTLGGTCFACAKDGGDQQDRHRTYPLQFHARCCSMSVAKLRVTQQIRHKNHLLSVACPTFPTTCSTTQVHYRMWIVVPKAPISISWLLVAVRPAPVCVKAKRVSKTLWKRNYVSTYAALQAQHASQLATSPIPLALGFNGFNCAVPLWPSKIPVRNPSSCRSCAATRSSLRSLWVAVLNFQSGGEKMKATQSQHVTTPRVLCSGIGVDTTAKALLTC